MATPSSEAAGLSRTLVMLRVVGYVTRVTPDRNPSRQFRIGRKRRSFALLCFPAACLLHKLRMVGRPFDTIRIRNAKNQAMTCVSAPCVVGWVMLDCSHRTG
ncbi:hypothetical protein AA313_de0210008 [Arthrobotrys entomopaga]|nr:hypothetical protein AA313_de0210008 [Arthrobotrys entomopaga]